MHTITREPVAGNGAAIVPFPIPEDDIIETVSGLPLVAGAATATGTVAQDGYVPDAQTAITIARAVLIPIYGAQTIQSEEPLTAKREGDVWTVTGTLQCPQYKARARPRIAREIRHLYEMCSGGTAELKLSAKDGRILHVIHGQ